MSGHSEWANKKHRKEKSDAQKAKYFTKIGREISVAVKVGGSADPNLNTRLAAAIAKAKQYNMPNDNIARSIKNASGLGDKNNYEEVTYECYGPCGTAFIVQTLTDNKNRTAGDVRHIFEKSGGSMGTTNCVSFMFDRLGVISVDLEGKSASALEDACIMIDGVQDFKSDDESFIVYTDPSQVLNVAKQLEEQGYKVDSSQAEMVAQSLLELDEEKMESFEKLLEKLDDNDDIQEYYHNVKL